MAIHLRSLSCAAALLLLLSACTVGGPGTRVEPEAIPVPEAGRPADHPRSAAEQSGPAVLALLAQADAALEAGAYQRAMSKLENALRIESRNPFVWQRLARVHLLEQRPDQAETFAERSLSLSRGNPWLALRNWQVIAEARRARGDRPGAEVAAAKVAELERQLEP